MNSPSTTTMAHSNSLSVQAGPSNRQSSSSSTDQQQRRYPSSPSSTASSESDDDGPGPDPPRRGDDRNLRVSCNENRPTAPALATPSVKVGSHPWPFNSLSPRLPNINNINSHPSDAHNSPSSIIPETHESDNEGTVILPDRQTKPGSTTNGVAHRSVPLSSSLPHEILIQILRSVSSTNDLRRALLVCKAWCQCGVELLWHKPTFPSTSCLIKMLVSLASKNQTFPYISFIRRLNFSGIADHMTDHILLRLVNCTRLERLTLSGCNSITDASIIKILRNSKDLVALDLSDCKLVTDQCIHAVGQHCKLLQGLNLSGCKAMTDSGLKSLRHCKALRRLKLKYCEKITDAALVVIAVACPLLLEVDLVGCRLVTNASLWMLWKNSSHLRELSLSGCAEISDGGFPSASNSSVGADGEVHPILEAQQEGDGQTSAPSSSIAYLNPELYPSMASSSTAASQPFDGATYDFISSLALNRRLEESSMHFDHIRFLDLTSLAKLTDASLDGIIKHMPRIRNLVLAKCVGLTDEALNSICGLGKYLHYLHLGHVSSLTDRAVIRVARSCTRLRYIDLACCNNLTDMSVFELAQSLPRLKRIGLVRVTNITDQSVYTLVERTSLERIHLSYCDNISVGAIHWLLQRLHRLTHLSLTGVPAFRRTDLQAWCRAPPKDFNAHQRQAFCVYSGKGVTELRYYLAALYLSITSNNSRSRVGQPFLSTTGAIDDDHSNNLTLSAAPIGTNLSVFNSMPDPRTMAAAMAAARQQTNPQLYSYGNRRRELRLPERSGRVVLSDFLHQGPSANVNAAVISGNGQLLSLPSLPRQVSRRFIQANGDLQPPPTPPTEASNGGNGAGSNSLEARLDPAASAGPSSRVGLSPRGEEQSRNEEGLLVSNGSTVNGLRSPIPLYSSPLRPRTPNALRERQLADGDGVHHGSSSTPSSGRVSRLNVPEDLPEPPGGMSGVTGVPASAHQTTGHELRITNHSLTRRRSDVEMAVSISSSSSSNHRHTMNPESSGGGVVDELRIRGIGSSDGTSNRMNLDIPDRADSVSPIDISDDERPPP